MARLRRLRRRALRSDGGSPLSSAYSCPFDFNGTIHRVVVDLSEGHADPAGEYRAALAEA